MTNIPIGNSQVTIKFLMPSPGGLRNAALVFGVATSPDPVTLTQIITLYNDDVFHDLGSDKVSIVGGRMTDNVAIADSSVSFTGGHGGALPPPNVSLLVKKVTGLGGRINQGRMYPPGLVYENTYDDSGIMSAG